MNGSRLSCFLVLGVLAFLFEACLMGGGSEDPSVTRNREIIGSIHTNDGKPSARVKVVLSQVEWTPQGSNTVKEDTTTTDSSGGFRFPNLDSGAYCVRAEDDSGWAALAGPAAVRRDSVVELRMTLKEKVDLSGRILRNASQIQSTFRVFVIGLDEVAEVDSDGVYALKDVPQGNLNLVFASDSTADFLPIRFREDADSEAYVEDVTFVEDSGTDTSISRDPPGISSSYDVIETAPMQYPVGQEPIWYRGKDIEEIIYPDTAQ